MSKIPFFCMLLLLALMMLLAESCKKEIRSETVEENVLTSSLNAAAPGGTAAVKLQSGLLKSVRRATERFHSTTQAIKAGYQPDEHCVSVPGLGGMGYHWVNQILVDPVFNPLKPEAVLYAKGPGGNLRLIALEYIVINTGQARPSFGGQLFDIGGTPVPVPHWSLHVWLYEENPSGIFAPFNPNISCP